MTPPPTAARGLREREGRCRLRHLEAWLTAEAKRQIADKAAQVQASGDREKDGVVIEVRSNCDNYHLDEFAEKACRALWDGRRVRVHVRHTALAIDAAAMLAQFCEYVQQRADIGTEVVVHFRQELPVFNKTGAMMVLAPRGEGSSRTKLIDWRTMQQYAEAYQRSEDADFARELETAGEYEQQNMEEARRRMSFGAQEDFLSMKQRDWSRLSREEPWTIPATPHESDQLERERELRAAGEQQVLDTGFVAEVSWPEQEIQSPAETAAEVYGRADDSPVDTLDAGVEPQPVSS
eukprot:TRINITY_DN14015_c0_g1_i1.p1 TRINITY_DN14015_c0_g1~~TRINITY_DN14015_c0_g1_i1.p1  ORF type:complete len:293 (+),score=77.42 TRINITY_DN14015_c0_g1_i1:571-1449(+)